MGDPVRESAHWIAAVARGLRERIRLRRAAARLVGRRQYYGPPDGRKWDVSTRALATRYLLTCAASPQVAIDAIGWCANHNPGEFLWWMREMLPWKARTTWGKNNIRGSHPDQWEWKPPLPCAYCTNPLALCGCDAIVCADCHWPSNRCVCSDEAPPVPVGVDTFVEPVPDDPHRLRMGQLLDNLREVNRRQGR